MPSWVEMSTGVAPAPSTASHGPVSSTCSMPSGATRKATLARRPVSAVVLVSVVLVMVVSSRSDEWRGRRAVPTRDNRTPTHAIPHHAVAEKVRVRAGSVRRMALHCAATLVLVPVGTAPDDAAGPGAVVAAPLGGDADVVDELQALADLHRGERVVVPVAPEQLDAVLEHLGRARAGR